MAYTEQEVETLLGDVDENELFVMIQARQLFVARKDGEVVALAGWKGSNLRHAYVDPDYTRRGIATRLLGRVEGDFRVRTHLAEITCGVVLYARPFYVANGYEVVSREKDWDGSEYFEMVKRF